MNKKQLGQVFTPKIIVDKMISLISIKNPKLILETSSGSGNFYFPLKERYENIVGIEIDEKIAHKDAVISSYFDTNYKPNIIIGNPPYVDFKEIINKPTNTLLIHKPNLYFFFLEKALSDLKENGELIWIVPASVFSTSSSKKINRIINENYSITYWEQVKENIWENASIPTAIIKIIKSKNHKDKVDYFYSKDKIFFGEKPKWNIQDIKVKVGGASGFNSLLQKGDTPFIVSHTERTKKLNYIDYEPKKWIRPTPKAPPNFTYQIFVNCKTRNKKPFYMLEDIEKGRFLNYDASVLCLFVNCDKNEALKIIKKLNSINWKFMGILRDGRHHFTQSILTAIF